MKIHPISSDTTEKLLEEEIQDIKNKAVSGVKTMSILAVGQIILRVLSTKTTSVYLSKIDFENFAIGSNLTGVGQFLSDVGLAGALVRKNTEPTDDELTTVFISQQLLASSFVITTLLLLSFIKNILKMNNTSVCVLIFLSFGVFLSTLRIIPMLVMERNLKFDAIARCEMLESIVQVIVTVVMTLMRFGVWSLIVAYWARGIVGLISIWISSPWRPRGCFRFAIVQDLARFGLPYQLNALIPTLGDFWVVAVFKNILTDGALGLVTWSSNIASVPMTINNMLVRVAYPTYSRLQRDSAALGHALKSAISRLIAIFELTISPFVTLCPFLIPYLLSPKWILAIPIVQWLCIQAVVNMLLGTICSMQNALGKASERMWVTIAMGLLRWLTGYWAIVWFGIEGYGPIGLMTGVLELGVSAAMVRRHNSQSTTLLRDIFCPLTISWVTLVLAMAVGEYLGQGSFLKKSIISTLAWILFFAGRELFTPFYIFKNEAGPLMSLLKLRKN